jgi:16S rRNA processing protein RimM
MRRVVARVGRAHGIRGEVSIEVRTDVPEQRFVDGAVLFPAAGSGVAPAPGAGPAACDPAASPPSLTITRVRDHNGTLLLTFAEVAGRDAAEQLRNVLLEADVEIGDGEPDAWYDEELVGLAVTGPDGVRLGTVVGVRHLPAQDLLVIDRPGGERLVPFVRELVPVVDVPGGRLVVDPRPGLLDDADA